MADAPQQGASDRYPWLASMLQTVDPLFPIGSYAHSYGLEELVAMGEVTTEHELSKYLETIVDLNLSQFELPYLRFQFEAQTQEDWAQVERLDQEIGASKLSAEIRTASSAQGQQRLRILAELRPSNSFQRLERLSSEKRIAPHHITVYAAERIQLSTPLDATLMSWTYQAFAAPCAAALKIMRIGQEAAQRVLTQALESLPRTVERSYEVDREWSGAFNPLIDIASDRHERAYARLFIS